MYLLCKKNFKLFKLLKKKKRLKSNGSLFGTTQHHGAVIATFDDYPTIKALSFILIRQWSCLNYDVEKHLAALMLVKALQISFLFLLKLVVQRAIVWGNSDLQCLKWWKERNFLLIVNCARRSKYQKWSVKVPTNCPFTSTANVKFMWKLQHTYPTWIFPPRSMPCLAKEKGLLLVSLAFCIVCKHKHAYYSARCCIIFFLLSLWSSAKIYN